MTGPLYTLRRTGGREPSDDEQLEVADDGSFRMWRTVGWTRVGAFAGNLAPDDLEELRVLSSTAPPEDLDGGVPRGAAAEEHVAGGGRLVLGGSNDPPPAWQGLVATGRRLLDDLVVAPEAAVELEVVGPSEATLRVVGDEPLALALSSLRWRVERLAPDGTVVAGWRPPGEEGGPLPEYVTVDELRTHDPGPIRTLVLGHGWELASGELLRVWVTLSVAPPAGSPRTARLVAVNP